MHTIPPPFDDQSFLAWLLAVLAAMESRQRNALLMLLDCLNNLPKEDLALLAKAVMPHLTKAELAILCGVDVRTVQRWERLKAIWPRKVDHWRGEREQWSTSSEPADLADLCETR